ncbi:hypothetical protein L6R46_24410 [Myxococcota bacterium]|nr:hypothetical protein [Myxococcota bacterium]
MTLLTMLALLGASNEALACDPMPPHVQKVMPADDQRDVPAQSAIIMRLPLLYDGQEVGLSYTADGSLVTLETTLIAYAPTAAEQVFREGALLIARPTSAVADGSGVLTVTGVTDPGDWDEETVLKWTLVAADPLSLSAAGTATATLGAAFEEEQATCGTEKGRLLSVTLGGYNSEAAVAAVLVRTNDGVDTPLTADLTGGAASLTLIGLVEQDELQTCWRVDVYGQDGGVVSTDETCTDAGTDTGGDTGGGDDKDDGGCSTSPGGLGAGWLVGLLALLSRRRA